MDTPVNTRKPSVMHIDLNSCFATVTQQAYPHLRGKPLVIAAYMTGGGCILAPSIEAKKMGIKTGMRVREAKTIYPDVVVRGVDTRLIRDVHKKFKRICERYSPSVTPKSIDEVVVDFKGENNYLKKELVDIGCEIKKRFRQEIGEWISCNVGIGTNRFLAKLASSLHKPDGLDLIDHTNLKEVYSKIALIDLNGINVRYQARLNAFNIFTPLEFLGAGELFLMKQVFQSIVGRYWYLRLRGFEVDEMKVVRKSFGQDYALGEKTKDPDKIKRIIMKLCEKMGRRLRASGNSASGIHLMIWYEDWSFWHRSKKIKKYLYTTRELFSQSMSIFEETEVKKIVRKISVSCFDLTPKDEISLNLFEDDKKYKLSQALDKINDRYGEYAVVPATMMNMDKTILDRIAFGGI